MGSRGVAASSLIIRASVVCPSSNLVMVHNSESTKGLRNRNTITVVVAEDVGNVLRAVVLRQLPNLDQWDWGRLGPRICLGNYSLRGKGGSGLASAQCSGSSEGLRCVSNNKPWHCWRGDMPKRKPSLTGLMQAGN